MRMWVLMRPQNLCQTNPYSTFFMEQQRHKDMPLHQSREATWAGPGESCCLQSGVGGLGQRLPTSFCRLWLPFACANDHNLTFYRILWLKWNRLTIAAARPEWCRVLMRVLKAKSCSFLLFTSRLKPDSFSGATCALAASPSGTRTFISWFQTWTQGLDRHPPGHHEYLGCQCSQVHQPFSVTTATDMSLLERSTTWRCGFPCGGASTGQHVGAGQHLGQRSGRQ